MTSQAGLVVTVILTLLPFPSLVVLRVVSVMLHKCSRTHTILTVTIMAKGLLKLPA